MASQSEPSSSSSTETLSEDRQTTNSLSQINAGISVYGDITRQLLAIYGENTNSTALFDYLNQNIDRYSQASQRLPFPTYLEGMVQIPRTRSIVKDFLHEDVIRIGFTIRSADPIMEQLEDDPNITKYSMMSFLRIVLDQFFLESAKSYSFNPFAYDYIMIQHFRQPILLLRNLNRVPMTSNEHLDGDKFCFLPHNSEITQPHIVYDNYDIPVSSPSSFSLFLELTSVKQVIINHLNDYVTRDYSLEVQRLRDQQLNRLMLQQSSTIERESWGDFFTKTSAPVLIAFALVMGYNLAKTWLEGRK